MRYHALAVVGVVGLFIFATCGIVASELKARLSLSAVAAIAVAQARNEVKDIARFKAEAPKYDAATRTWTVFFRQAEPPFVPDHDFSVKINDSTGTACLELAFSPPCA
jgi:hypothetical protein